MSHVSALSFPASVLNPLKLKFSLRQAWILLGIFVFSLLVFYVLQVNLQTKEIYQIKNYENKLLELGVKNEDLEINFSKANSFVNLEAYLQNKNFEKTTKVKYVQILENQVAAK